MQEEPDGKSPFPFGEEYILTSVLDNLPDIIGLKKPDFTLIKYNQAGLRRLNLGPGEVGGRKCYEILGQELECYPCPSRQALNTNREAVTIKYLKKSGTYMKCRSIPLLDEGGEVKLLVQHLQDITEYKNLEEELGALEREYEAVFDSSHEAIFLADVGTDGTFRFRRCNKNFRKLMGLSGFPIQGLTPREALGEDLGSHIEANCQLCFNTRASQSYEETIPSPLGQQVWHTTLVPVICQGRVTQIISSSRDITGQKETEAALRESEKRYRSLVEFSPDGIIVSCGERIVFANSAAASILGADKPEQLVGHRWKDFLHPDTRSKVLALREKVLVEGKILPTIKEKVVRLDGTVAEIEAAKIPFTYRGRPAVQAVLRDIAPRTRIEEEALKASKLESLSLLASGIAHDFNNILTILLGNISLAKMYINSSKELEEKLADVEAAALQAQDITQQLLTFARDEKPKEKKALPVEKLVKTTASLALSGSNVRSRFFSPQTWTRWPLMRASSNR